MSKNPNRVRVVANTYQWLLDRSASCDHALWELRGDPLLRRFTTWSLSRGLRLRKNVEKRDVVETLCALYDRAQEELAS